MSRKFAATAVLLLFIGALSTATAEPQAAGAAPAGGFMRRLFGTTTFGHGFGLGSLLGGGSSYASSSAYAGSGYYGNRYYDPYYDPYYGRPYYGGGGYYGRRNGPGRGFYGRKLAMA